MARHIPAAPRETPASAALPSAEIKHALLKGSENYAPWKRVCSNIPRAHVTDGVKSRCPVGRGL